jgi:hypothetical protein
MGRCGNRGDLTSCDFFLRHNYYLERRRRGEEEKGANANEEQFSLPLDRSVTETTCTEGSRLHRSMIDTRRLAPLAPC